MLLGLLAHPRRGGEVGGGLSAAVQHDDERTRSGAGGGDVEGVRPGPGRTLVDAVQGVARQVRRRRAGLPDVAGRTDEIVEAIGSVHGGRVVVAQAFLVDDDLALHDPHRVVARERPLDQGRRLGEPTGAGQRGRLGHRVQVITVHGRLLVVNSTRLEYHPVTIQQDGSPICSRRHPL